MLIELIKKNSQEGELTKRWFFSQEIDLVIWVDINEKPCAFQLAYDKYKSEKSFSWHHKRGYRIYKVDDGEHASLWNKSPMLLLYSSNEFEKKKVMKVFQEQSVNLPEVISSFVLRKIKYYRVKK